MDDLVRNSLFDRRSAADLIALRRAGPIGSTVDLVAARLIRPDKLLTAIGTTYGARPVRPLLTAIRASGDADRGPGRVYVDETFSVRFDFTPGSSVRPEILSLAVRFPSGRRARIHRRLSAEAVERGSVDIGGFVSRRSGEFFLLATLRDEAGGTHCLGANVGIFTRNPVQMYVTPGFWTQSGNVGAPKFDFGTRRWQCFADVEWVNGTDNPVNLGRTVTVRATDSGNEVKTFSFDLSGDVVVEPWSSAYGNWFTSHSEGGNIFQVFHAKGDLTFEYSMSGSGFTPRSDQVWRTMRVIGYNIIRVGDFSAEERNEYRRAAADIASGIYQARDLTVYGVELYRIEGTPQMDADKARFRFIDSQSEINDLRSAYTVDNWYLDVFFVEGRFDGAFGSSPVDGPVDKQGASSGLVVRRDSDTVNLGQTFAHEGGHYLGLEHADEDDGLADTDPSASDISDNFMFSLSRSDSDVVTPGQINRVRKHGLVHSMTP
ncbi:MAG TPA: hypothetical protein VF718_13440 [Allosphingosinicella sp.]